MTKTINLGVQVQQAKQKSIIKPCIVKSNKNEANNKKKCE